MNEYRGLRRLPCAPTTFTECEEWTVRRVEGIEHITISGYTCCLNLNALCQSHYSESRSQRDWLIFDYQQSGLCVRASEWFSLVSPDSRRLGLCRLSLDNPQERKQRRIKHSPSRALCWLQRSLGKMSSKAPISHPSSRHHAGAVLPAVNQRNSSRTDSFPQPFPSF